MDCTYTHGRVADFTGQKMAVNFETVETNCMEQEN